MSNDAAGELLITDADMAACKAAFDSTSGR
jgi:hypothetical protein